MIQSGLVIRTLGKFCELSAYPFDYLSFKEKQPVHSTRSDFQNIGAFEEELMATGDFFSLSFIRRKFTVSELQAALDTQNAPFIVYRKGENVIPLLLFKSEKQIRYCEINGDEIREGVCENLTAWLSDVNGDLDGVFPVLTGVMAQSVESPDGIKLTPVKRLIRLFNLEKRDIYHIYFLALIVGLISLSLPLGVQAIIGLISGGLIIQSVVVLIMLVIMGTTLSGWLQIKQLELVETIQQRVFARSSFEYSFRLPRLKLEAMSDSYPPEMVNRFFDITNLQKGMPKLLIDFTGAILQIFFGLILLSFYHSMFILFGLLLVAILLIIFRFTGPRGLKTSLYESKYKYKVASWLEELARAINSIKLAGYTRLHIDKTDLYVSQYLKSRKAHFKVLKQQYAAMVVFKTVITAGLLILGSQLVVSRQINLGQFVAAEIVILLVITSVEKFIQSLEVIYDTLTAVEKMGALTDIPMESETGLPLSVTGNVDALSLRLNEVGYKYPSMNKAALQNVSFTLGAGSRMAITGTSGAGKSTLLKLVAGLFQNYSGSVMVNGFQLKEINLISYRDRIGECLSSAEVFEGSLYENITAGKAGITPEQVIHAVDVSGLRPYVDALNDGLHTHIVAGGTNVNETIRTRIILARSIAETPAFMIMDDLLYPLHYAERNKIMAYLTDRSRPWTLLCVSQDPALLQLCDQVVWMEEGKVKQTGHFNELKTNPAFINTIHPA